MWTYHQYQRLTAPTIYIYIYIWMTQIQQRHLHQACQDNGLSKLWDTFALTQGRVSVYACAKHTTHSSIPVLFTVNAYSRTIEAALNICKYKPAAACYAVSHAANFPRPNLDLPRGFSCYWRDAQPSCRLHASHTSADSTYDNHLFHLRHKA